MTDKARMVAPLFAAAAVAAVIAASPDAFAANTRICSDGGGSTICHSPGNVEVHTKQPQVQPPRVYGEYASPLPFLFN
jgi:hypothetical protein